MSTDGHGFQLGCIACTKTSGALLAGRLLQPRSTMLSRNTLPVLAIVVTSAAAGSKALPSTTQHGYPRRAFLTATAVALPCSLALAPCPAAAKLLNPAVTWTQQEQLMRTHAARFEQSTPVAVRTTSIARRRLRELVATVDLPVPPLLTCPPMLQPCHAYGLRAPASVPEARGSSCGPTPLAPGLTRCHALWPQAAPHTPWLGPTGQHSRGGLPGRGGGRRGGARRHVRGGRLPVSGAAWRARGCAGRHGYPHRGQPRTRARKRVWRQAARWPGLSPHSLGGGSPPSAHQPLSSSAIQEPGQV